LEKIHEATYESIRKAAEVHRLVRQDAQSWIKPGMKMIDICKRLETRNKHMVEGTRTILLSFFFFLFFSFFLSFFLSSSSHAEMLFFPQLFYFIFIIIFLSFIRLSEFIFRFMFILCNPYLSHVVARGLECGIAFPTGCSINRCAAHYTPNTGGMLH
jgi:hypothetical protein